MTSELSSPREDAMTLAMLVAGRGLTLAPPVVLRLLSALLPDYAQAEVCMFSWSALGGAEDEVSVRLALRKADGRGFSLNWTGAP